VSEVVVRAGSLYVPILAAMTAGLLRRPGRRLLAGCLLSFLWAMTSLVLLQYLNAEFGWWSFSATEDVWFCGMPLELYFGWAALWGVAPQLLFRRMPLLGVAVVMACFDLAVMPRCVPVVRLAPAWLLGEGAAIVLVLLPAIAIARWTAEDTHLNLRAAAQVAISGMLFLLLLPQVVFTLRPGRGWVPLLAMPSSLRQLMLQRLENRQSANTGVEHPDGALPHSHSTSGRMCGNRITSRIDGESVRNIASRSMPTPRPAVGGMPYSSARM